MTDVERVLMQISFFHRAFDKALKAKRDRSEWIAEAENAIYATDRLLTQPTVVTEVDALLKQLTDELQKTDQLAVAAQLIPHGERLAAFLKAESRLHYFSGLNARDYELVVALVRPFLMSPSETQFPRSAEELRQAFVVRASQYVSDVKGTAVLPRREKRQTKEALGFDIWRYSVGTIMTLSNIFWAYKEPPLVAAGIASASITCGSRLFAMSGRKPPAQFPQPKDTTKRPNVRSA